MEEIDLNTALARDDLFTLFKLQLKKDFESVGVNGTFIDDLPLQLEALKQCIVGALKPLQQSNANGLMSLLYRIDISETQLKNYHSSHPGLGLEELLAELIIKRVLQKVILKKKFSE
jgi:hypothetical protein